MKKNHLGIGVFINVPFVVSSYELLLVLGCFITIPFATWLIPMALGLLSVVVFIHSRTWRNFWIQEVPVGWYERTWSY